MTLPTNVWLRRGLALAVGVIAAAIVYWVMNLPAASPVDDAKNWTLDAGDQVSLLGPTTGHVLTVQGPAGKGVGVRFANAALTPSSAAGLQAIGVAVNGQPSNVQWITEDGGVTYNVAYSLVTVSNGAPVTNTNSAYALADCKGCTTVAVSFQVVLIVGQSKDITPINAAGALNTSA